MTQIAPAIGIDLGTTFSCLGVFRFGKVEIIANNYGNRITPSVVSFDDSERLVGEAALQQQNANPENTIFDAKRLMGQKFNAPELQEDLLHWPFCVMNNDNRPTFRVTYQGQPKIITPEEVSALVLGNMKQIAEDYLGSRVHSAVITVPAYFNDLQRKATKDAAEIAGLEVLRIINEPTAAAIAYGFCIDRKEIKKVLVYDLGGGTFDVSILTIEDKMFTVNATGGNTHLGGEDFDRRMVNHFIAEIKRKHKKDISTDKKSLSKLRKACEMAKRSLSMQTVANIFIESLFDGIDFKSTISVALFDELNADLFSKTLDIIHDTLKEANMNKQDIDEILLIGGSTRIPKVQRLVKEYFEKSPLKSINPDEAVAYGACITAAMLNGDRSVEIMKVLLKDVTPLSLGTDVSQDEMSVVIKRNTQIPTSYTQSYITSSHNQTSISVKVAQGESIKVSNNILLGNFVFPNIPPAPMGKEKVAITFSIDADGIMKVSATLESTGKEMGITVNTKGHLTKQDIDRMIKNSIQEKAEDMKRKEVIQVKKQLSQICLKMMLDLGELKKGQIRTPSERVVLYKCQMNLEWLETAVSNDKEVYEERIEKLRAICAPFLASKVVELE